ncbi:MAG: GGDEF domain-containing protein [Deltaproteobacteria bacterium]|jgi:diguanylate cyclase (GGDEF)-like protein|nr:GGDEF domain-containing protein [Deltaproteobacteria bacterium]
MEISIDGLKGIDLFRNIELKKVPTELEGAQIKEFLPGSIILSPENENRSIYFLLSGQLGVHLESPDSRMLRTIEPGDCVGELSLIEDINPSAYVLAREPSRLLKLSNKTLWEMVFDDGRIAKNLLSIISKRLLHNTQLILQEQTQSRQLEQFAMVDGLTGIYNRRWFDKAMNRHLSRYKRCRETFTLCMADVDHFKHYNDNYGHQAGDVALSTLSKVLSENIRPTDFAARYGGEEFAIILPDTRVENAEIVAARLCNAVKQARIVMSDGKDLPSITISMGIAQMCPAYTPANLIEAADKQLYQAKQEGRDRFCTDFSK